MLKHELEEWFTTRNIPFPKTATAVQLKRLRLSEMQRLTGEQGGGAQNPDGEAGNQRAGTPTPADDDGAAARLRQLEQREAVLAAEQRVLEAETRVARLRAELAQAAQAVETARGVPQGGQAAPAAQIEPVRQAATYKDIKYSVLPFSGGPSYDANKWLADFERACNSVDGDAAFRLKCIRRLMKAETEAELFLRTDDSVTYDAFRANFLANFGHTYSVTDVLEMMRKAVYIPSKISVMGYVLQMQELALRANVDEAQTIRFITEGLRDRSANVALLYPATTLAGLKALVPRYVQMREASAASYVRGVGDAKPKATANRPDAAAAGGGKPAIRCYNCSGVGHVSAKCPEPKRVIGSCFRCGSTQHMLKDCPKPAPTGQVALIDEFRGERASTSSGLDELTQRLGEANVVSVTFHSDCSVPQCDALESLFDTGSPISLLRRSALRTKLTDESTTYSGFRGLGSFRLCTYGKFPIEVTFRNQTKPLTVYVVSDCLIPCPLLLGRDFLKAFKIGLSMYNSIPNTIPKPKIELSCDSDVNKISVSDQVLHCVYGTIGDQSIMGGVCDRCRSAPRVVSCGPDVSNFPSPPTTSIGHSVPDIFFIEYESDDSAIPFTHDTNFKSNAFPTTHIYATDQHIFSIDADRNSVDLYDINPKLNPFHRESVLKIIRADYLDTANIPIIPHDFEMKLRLSSDQPINSPPRRLSYADKQLVDSKVSDLLSKGIIRPSHSPYSFPVVIVPKGPDDKRMCVDYRPLNKITLRDNYPLPLMEDCVERMEGKTVFSLFDLRSGFFHVPIASESVPLTSFVTPNGQYEYLRMPFGLCNAPAVFQRFINFVLRPFIDEGSVIVYIDDIALGSRTMPEHLDLVRRVLRQLAGFRLELNLDKCRFCYDKLDLLGFSIDRHGIRPNDRHIENIRRLPLPTNAGELHKYLGLFSYFRRFVPSFTSIALPLRALLKPDANYVFGEECVVAFNKLRDKLISIPVLALYNPQRETELHCDASAVGFGGILLQRQDDGKFHPTAYFSKRATEAESRYHSFELETLAIIYSLRKFRVYLEGIPFKIITDCNSLALTLGRQGNNARIARWALELENYNYSVQHRSGSLMGHVDALSRCPPREDRCSDGSMGSDRIISVVNADDVDLQLQITQNRDENILSLREQLEKGDVENYALEDGLVYRKTGDRLLLYVPSEMEENVVRNAHEATCHLGVAKCVDQIKLHYWFPRMQEKVEKVIRNCLQCIMYSVPAHSGHRTLHPIPKRPIPFDTVHVDHFGPLPALISKRKHILVIVDAFTKHVKLYAVNSTSTKEVCACLDRYSEYYSRPRRVVSDRGTCFTSHEFESYLLDNNIEHVKVASASPQANGQVERVNRVIKAMLSKISDPIQHSNWSKLLTRVEYAINNSVHSVTKETPSRLLFGVGQRGREVDALSEFLESRHPNVVDRDLAAMRDVVSERIGVHQEKTSEYYARNHRPHATFSEGDFVVIRNVDTTIGTNKKFIPKFKGPYRIHRKLPNDRYVVKDIEGFQVTQLPYDGVIEASRMRSWADWRSPDADHSDCGE